MLEKLQEMYNSITGTDSFEINLKTKIKDLQLSSLALIQLICEIEDTFDIEISNKELQNFITVGNIVTVLEKKVK